MQHCTYCAVRGANEYSNKGVKDCHLHEKWLEVKGMFIFIKINRTNIFDIDFKIDVQ